jgi:hypothetical protein
MLVGSSLGSSPPGDRDPGLGTCDPVLPRTTVSSDHSQAAVVDGLELRRT